MPQPMQTNGAGKKSHHTNNSTPKHVDTQTLAAAVEALLAGDVAKASELLAARREHGSGSFTAVRDPVDLQTAVPGIDAANADVAAAQTLLSEAVRRRSELLKKTTETHGTGPFRTPAGGLVRIVRRGNATNPAEVLCFLRTVYL